jgi:penicillin-binding protein 2
MFNNKNRFTNRDFDIENPLEYISEDADFRFEDDEKTVDSTKNDKKMLWVVISILLLALFSRTFFLQIIKGAHFKEVAENNRVREVVVKAPRGIIRDEYGEVLARNIPSFEVVFVPLNLPEDESSWKELSGKLAELLGGEQKQEEILSLLLETPKTDRRNYLIQENVEQDKAFELIERSNEFPGIYIGKTARRDYVDGEVFSKVIGYDGKITKEELVENPTYLMTDYLGKTGIEYTYEKQLHGIHGMHRFEVDAVGSVKEDLGEVSPIPGDELVLHIDAKLQKEATEIAKRTLEKNEDATGIAIVAINPQTGGIRALVSLPSFDNNLFARGISNSEYQELVNNEKKPLLDRTIKGEYPPGSPYKIMMAAAVLEEGIVTEDTQVNCAGSIHVGAWPFPDWKAHGATDIRKAIAQSCDVFFYTVSGGWGDIGGIGIERMEIYAKMFGYGEVTGIDLPGEKSGNVPNGDWKFKRFGENWYIGDTYHASIGQGYVTATPLQVAHSISIIANGGKAIRPKIVDKIIHADTGEVEILEPDVTDKQVVSGKTVEVVRQGMRDTVFSDGGSGSSLRSLSVETAGKTGTSQFGTEEKLHSWYSSFAPFENPELAMIVLVEGGGEGHSWAVPITKEIYEWYFDRKRGEIEKETEKEITPVEVIPEEIISEDASIVEKD